MVNLDIMLEAISQYYKTLQEQLPPVFDRVTSYSNEYDNTLNLINVGYSTQIKSGIMMVKKEDLHILYQTDYISIQNEELIPWGHQHIYIMVSK